MGSSSHDTAHDHSRGSRCSFTSGVPADENSFCSVAAHMKSDMLSAAGFRSNYVAWERAEIARSDVEASQTSADKLRLGARTRRRYLNATADSAYPLEYAH